MFAELRELLRSGAIRRHQLGSKGHAFHAFAIVYMFIIENFCCSPEQTYIGGFIPHNP